MSWKNQFDERELKEIEFSQVYFERFGHGSPGHLHMVIIAKLTDLVEKWEPDFRETIERMAFEQNEAFARKVVEALYSLREKTTGYLEYFYMGHIAEEIELLFDVSESPRKIGHVVRNILGLEVGRRQRDGYPVIWDAEKMDELRERFGL